MRKGQMKRVFLVGLAGLVALAGIAVPVTTAGAHSISDSSTQYSPAHIHTRVHWFLNEVDDSLQARINTREA